jgi:hypothetical protein
VNRIVQIVLGVKTLIVVASSIALLLEAFLVGETVKIEKDTSAIQGQIKDLMVEVAKYQASEKLKALIPGKPDPSATPSGP